MTGTEPHAPRGTAGRGPNWDRGPGAGRAGAARRWTTWHRRPWAQPGPPAVDGPRRLRVDACASRHRRPRDHSWDRGPYAGRRSCATRSGPTRLRMPTLAPPAAGPARGPWAASGPEELRDSEWSRGCRRDAVTVCLSISCTGGHGNDHVAIILFTSRYWSLRKGALVSRKLPLSEGPRVLKQTARKLVSPVTTQIVCESRRHSLFRRQSTQQQEQCAGSLRVKILYPKCLIFCS